MAGYVYRTHQSFIYISLVFLLNQLEYILTMLIVIFRFFPMDIQEVKKREKKPGSIVWMTPFILLLKCIFVHVGLNGTSAVCFMFYVSKTAFFDVGDSNKLNQKNHWPNLSVSYLVYFRVLGINFPEKNEITADGQTTLNDFPTLYCRKCIPNL